MQFETPAQQEQSGVIQFQTPAQQELSEVIQFQTPAQQEQSGRGQAERAPAISACVTQRAGARSACPLPDLFL